MRRSDARLAAALLVAALAASGCSPRRYAPDRWLPTADRVAADAYGGWARVQWQENEGRTNHEAGGELIAIDADSLFVLSSAQLIGLSMEQVSTVRVETYDPQAGHIVGAGVGGAISTLSHGAWLVLTAPMWMIVTTTSASMRGHEALAEYPRQAVEELQPYARYPGGLPPSLDRATLQPRPRPPDE